MSTTRNVKAQSRARYLLAVLVALAFAMCLAVPAAFAETGTITIKSQEGNAAASYDAYQIFAADIAANGEATDIQWAGADDAAKNAMKAAVEGAIKAHAGKWTAEDEAADATHVAGADKYTGTTAQDAADYISANIEGDTLTDPAQGESVYTLPNGTRVAADSFANLLAAAVDDTTKAATVAAGQVATLDEGYWLFVNTPEDPSGTVTQD
ncbi:MAG: hypothetical protein IJ131_05905, partial [Eggerthellaceae bacterium]|nr:hypothetical protein [Eggerthellaceae bacterium]